MPNELGSFMKRAAQKPSRLWAVTRAPWAKSQRRFDFWCGRCSEGMSCTNTKGEAKRICEITVDDSRPFEGEDQCSWGGAQMSLMFVPRSRMCALGSLLMRNW